ncbi:carbon-nitrogen hydrolase family protein [Modestobacter sp. SYSU DS0511]
MTNSSTTVKVAAVHAAAPFLDLEAGVQRACEFIREAGCAGAKLVAFPETFLPGYPYWIWSHTTKYAAPFFAELYANAVELPSEASRALGEAAREAGTWVVMGLNEKDGGTLYNTQAYFSPSGELVARHRKLHPTNAERTVWGRGDGRDVFVVDAGFARVGGLICFEHSMDLNRYALATLGEQIHVAAWPAINATHADPNAGNFDHYATTLAAAHAICAQTYVIVVQGRISEEIVERLGVPEGPDAPTVGGGLTGFMGPDGRWLTEPHRDEEAIVYAELDLGVIAFAKFFADGAGHYARPDVFSFGVDRTPQEPLTTQRVSAIETVLSPEDRPLADPEALTAGAVLSTVPRG